MPSSMMRRSAIESRPEMRVRRRLSTALGWSQTATEFGPADDVATTIGGLGSGPVESGTTTTVRRARLSALTVITTAGRGLRISPPELDRGSPTRYRQAEPQSGRQAAPSLLPI